MSSWWIWGDDNRNFQPYDPKATTKNNDAWSETYVLEKGIISKISLIMRSSELIPVRHPPKFWVAKSGFGSLCKYAWAIKLQTPPPLKQFCCLRSGDKQVWLILYPINTLNSSCYCYWQVKRFYIYFFFNFYHLQKHSLPLACLSPVVCDHENMAQILGCSTCLEVCDSSHDLFWCCSF